MSTSINDSILKAAMDAVASKSETIEEKVQMLIELAQDLQKQPKNHKHLKNTDELHSTILKLYNQAQELCGENYPLLKARAKVGIAGTLQTIPSVTLDLLVQAKTEYEEALPVLQQLGTATEVAEVQMNLGLALQSLANFGRAKISESIAMYKAALQVFNWQQFPQEYAILHNNIAIAYLSNASQEHLQHALAVQSFETALSHVNLIEHPSEYAMLQNNLGNAWQYLPSSHPVENSLRAVKAYQEALKVRNAHDTPLEYANTISNLANALSNIPDDLEKAELGNLNNLLKAQKYYQESLEIFTQNYQFNQAETINQILLDIQQEIKLRTFS
jgi:tetratricopeptide (TPR) repeat protein